LHTGVLTDRPFPDQSFDAITMVDFIEHVRDPIVEMAEARERLAPGGVLAVSTPRVDSVARRMLGSAWPQYREEHVSYLTRDGLRRLLGRAGLSRLSVRTTRKAVTLAYVHGQGATYPMRFVTPIVAGAYRALPPARHIVWRLPFGEMTITATRSGDERA
jgi:SAM-dependent methyltransferase